jgi:rhodanese-related sulfurtransferase
MMTTSSISAEELHEISERGERIALIDVRTPIEFRESHIPFAKNVPLNKITSAQLESPNGNGPVYVVCRTGSRAATACRHLASRGIGGAIVVEDGLMGWASAGFPVTRGKKGVSLERQVRIAAGAIVFVSSILALTVHPYFAAVAAFIGGGLAFAGITDSCAMGMLIARMPWNDVKTGGELTA